MQSKNKDGNQDICVDRHSKELYLLRLCINTMTFINAFVICYRLPYKARLAITDFVDAGFTEKDVHIRWK